MSVIGLHRRYSKPGRIELYVPECDVHMCDAVATMVTSYYSGNRKRSVKLCEPHAREWAKLHDGNAQGTGAPSPSGG